MGKGFFAIVLVAASFAGGAAVNGPGLKWARDLILNTSEAVADEVPAATTPAEPFPNSSAAPMLLGSGALGPKDQGRKDDTTPPNASVSRPAVAEAPLDLSARKAGDDSPRPEPSNGKKVDPPSVLGLGILSDLPPLDPPAPLATSDENARDVPGLAPSAEVPTRPKAAPEASIPGTSDGWTEVRRTMRDLGVARYGIEGEPGGRVRFHCVIPLAGRRAVGQHFEAEGDDELQAARTALRRVALWRATEAPQP